MKIAFLEGPEYDDVPGKPKKGSTKEKPEKPNEDKERYTDEDENLNRWNTEEYRRKNNLPDDED